MGTSSGNCQEGNLHGSGMSHATTAIPKPSFRAPWRVGDAVVVRGNAGWTSSKSGHPCSCQNCSQWPPPEKAGRGSLLNRPSSPLVNPIDQGTELNRILWSLHPMIYDCTPQNKASHQHDNKYVGLLMNRLPRIILTVFSDADGNYSVL